MICEKCKTEMQRSPAASANYGGVNEGFVATTSSGSPGRVTTKLVVRVVTYKCPSCEHIDQEIE